MTRCDQEMCPHWSGDGDVCPCAVFGIERAERECPICYSTLGSTAHCPSCDQANGAIL